jgi:guanylate kinase
MGRLVILSGPSCVGKGPLHRALRIFYPQLASELKKVVLYDSRAPRPGEVDGVDYHFRTREYIEQLRNKDNFLVTDVRGDLQALDLKYLRETIATGNVFFEGNPVIGMELMGLARREKIACLSVFLSPLSRAEIEDIRGRRDINFEMMLTDIMRRKLLRRTQKQKGILSLVDLENIELRAGSAYKEMKEAWRYDFVIPNHDGEDSENWDAFGYPVGDARAALLCFAEILSAVGFADVETSPAALRRGGSGGNPAYAQKWSEGLLP